MKLIGLLFIIVILVAGAYFSAQLISQGKSLKEQATQMDLQNKQVIETINELSERIGKAEQNISRVNSRINTFQIQGDLPIGP